MQLRDHGPLQPWPAFGPCYSSRPNLGGPILGDQGYSELWPIAHLYSSPGATDGNPVREREREWGDREIKEKCVHSHLSVVTIVSYYFFVIVMFTVCLFISKQGLALSPRLTAASTFWSQAILPPPFPHPIYINPSYNY